MTSPSTAIYTPFADGRTVHDIVEHSPALVNEAWCRNLMRRVLDSLEQQYASGAPHRHISPETLVMLGNGDALLLPAAEDAGEGAPDRDASLAGDLHALAQVVHYAITAELPPDGPVGPRLYDNYSDELTQGIDRCLGPNLRLRPRSIAEMRSLLGLDREAPAPGDGPASGAVPAPLAPAESFSHAQAQAAADASAENVGERGSDLGGDMPLPAPGMPAYVARDATDATMLAEHDAQETSTVRLAPADRAAPGMLRTPAAGQGSEADPFRDLGTPPAAPAAPDLERAPWEGSRQSRIQRWAMVAGAAVVLLAAGGALISFLQQSDSSDMPALALPPADKVGNGLAGYNTVPAPADPAATGAAGTAPGAPATGSEVAAGASPAAGAPEDAAERAAGVFADAAAVDAAARGSEVPGAAPVAVAPRGADAVVNGTTYKLRIKPWGTVYVNGIDRGVSPPVKRLTLGPGKHTIQIVNPNFPEHVRTLNAGAQEGGTIEHDFTAPTD